MPDPIISERIISAKVSSPWREISDNVELKRLVHKNNSLYPEATDSLWVRDVIDHPLISITLKVEYSINLNVENINKTCQFAVCYAHFLPEIDA